MSGHNGAANLVHDDLEGRLLADAIATVKAARDGRDEHLLDSDVLEAAHARSKAGDSQAYSPTARDGRLYPPRAIARPYPPPSRLTAHSTAIAM